MADLRDLATLSAEELTGRRARLEYLAERHKEPLRAACAADPDLWPRLYSYSMLGDAFDAWWDGKSGRTPDWISFALLDGDTVVGVSNYIDIQRHHATLEIGGTYFAPAARGTRLNDEVKLLMLGAAFAHGARRVELRVDQLNTRSQAACEKLGATKDGVLRNNRVTWTGRVRSSVVYSILDSEWPTARDRLASRV